MKSLWCAIAPTNYGDPFQHLSVPFEFDRGVTIREVPSWLKTERFANNLNSTHRYCLLNSMQYVFYTEYEADALGSPDPSWPGKEQRSIQDVQFDAIVLANLALWLARPNALGFVAIFHVDGLPRSPNFRSFQEVRNLEPHLRYAKSYLTLENQTQARALHTALLRLNRDGPVWRSVYSLWQALKESDWATRYFLLWISLESLFGPEDGRELSFRLSQRIGFFLGSDRVDAASICESAKKGYNWRSKVVHGLHLTKLDPEESIEISMSAEDLVNRTLNKILLDTNLSELFEGRKREDYLDMLPFQ